jgi:hypothetical protein
MPFARRPACYSRWRSRFAASKKLASTRILKRNRRRQPVPMLVANEHFSMSLAIAGLVTDASYTTDGGYVA